MLEQIVKYRKQTHQGSANEANMNLLCEWNFLEPEASKAPHIKQAIANESVSNIPKLDDKTLLGPKTAQGRE